VSDDRKKSISGLSAGAGAAAILHQFRRILENNNRVIETITKMERALGGEYVFDQAFLNSVVKEVLALVREVIYSLNAIADQRYLELYDRFTAIGNRLTDLVSGGPGPFDARLTLSYALLHRDLDYLVGAKNATLGEIANQLKLPTPDGFALTATAYELFLEEDGLGDDLQLLLHGPGDSSAKAAVMAQRLADARLPAALIDAVSAELVALGRRRKLSTLAVRSSAVGEDSCRSCAGQFVSVLNVKPKPALVLDAYRQVIASRFTAVVLDYLGQEASVRDFPMAVCVQTMVDAGSAGVIYTRDPLQPNANRLLLTAVAGSGAKLVGGRAGADRYVLDRHHPFSLQNSELLAAPTRQTPAKDGDFPLELLDNGLRRGTALLLPSQLRTLAETALLLEKAFDGAQDIEWALEADGSPVLLQSRPLILPAQPMPPPADVAAELRKATVLMRDCGSIVQLGVASGTVIQVTPESEPADFPVGAIAVCHQASPRLSPIVRKAAAVITDIGGPTVHLATIAREYRTPALFGTGHATSMLSNGEEITVDVENKVVYAGRIEGLISSEAAQEDLHMQSAEVRTMRRLLRWVAPLSLIDPASPQFLPANCQTLHDLIRFCHEKAMENLVRLQTDNPKIGAVAGRRLKTPLLSLRVIDLDNGLAPDLPPNGTVELPQVRCRPLQSLLYGLLDRQVWDREPVPFGIKDLMSSLSQPLSQIVNPPAYEGENLAIVAEDYCNLSLRLGYHFNVIDCFMSEDAEDNYIYFRFVGGFAARSKRQRRLEMISLVLANLHFKVEQKGDLLIGKAKLLTVQEMEVRLRQLGQLAAFSRQLDMRMDDEAAVEHFFSRFLLQIGEPKEAGPVQA